MLVGAAHLQPLVEIKRRQNGANYQRVSSSFDVQRLIIVAVYLHLTLTVGRVEAPCGCFVLLRSEDIIAAVRVCCGEGGVWGGSKFITAII